jgi:hypothetical protein
MKNYWGGWLWEGGQNRNNNVQFCYVLLNLAVTETGLSSVLQKKWPY